MKKLKPYIASLISGAALVLCFPPLDLWWLAFIALVPFLCSLYKADTSGEAFKKGLAMGLVYFFGTQFWVYHSITYYGGVSLWLSIVVVVTLALYQSLYTGLFGVLFRRAMTDSSLPAMLVAPTLWVVLEYLKTYIITGFPWSSIGYTQYLNLPFIQAADLGGVYLVSLCVVAVNAALVDLFIMKSRRRAMPLFNLAPTVAGYLVFTLLLAFVLIYGHQRLTEDHADAPLKVSVVQGNIEQDVKWDPAYQGMVLDTYERMSRTIAAERPDLIVWPESALPFYYGPDARNTDRLNHLQRSLSAPLLTGAVLVNPKSDGNHTLSNSAILLAAKDRPVYRYDKVHLVPFGEYVPLKGLLFFINKMVEGIGDFEPGESYARGQIFGKEFGTAICYEIVFPGLVRKFFKDGGDFLVTITNDAWFGDTPGPHQHFGMAVFRAVENRKPVVRAANTGVSGFIDSTGRILEASKIFTPAVMTRTIRTDRTRTFYTKYGDLVPYFCIIISIFIFANRRRQ